MYLIISWYYQLSFRFMNRLMRLMRIFQVIMYDLVRWFEHINSWEDNISSHETINHHYRLMRRYCIISWEHSKMLCMISWDDLWIDSWDDIVSSHENIPRYYVWSRELVRGFEHINSWDDIVSSHENIPRCYVWSRETISKSDSWDDIVSSHENIAK